VASSKNTHAMPWHRVREDWICQSLKRARARFPQRPKQPTVPFGTHCPQTATFCCFEFV
jgi:hypothetical protein